MKEGDKVEIFVNYGNTYTSFIGRLVSYGDSEVVIKMEEDKRTPITLVDRKNERTIIFNRRYVISITILEE